MVLENRDMSAVTLCNVRITFGVDDLHGKGALSALRAAAAAAMLDTAAQASEDRRILNIVVEANVKFLSTSRVCNKPNGN